MGDGRYEIDTGSGSIDLGLPRDASAILRAATGNGTISWKLSDVKIRRKERDDVILRIGDGAADLRLDTGSGAIRIHH